MRVFLIKYLPYVLSACSVNPRQSVHSEVIITLTLLTIPGPDWTSSSLEQLFNITIKEVLLPLPTSCTSADSNGI